jgi:hypothetical protein|tara:strand:+ start:147 stop:695 length:549 start_codon:yes stop_codon:yes gene_type:complete
MADLIFRQGVGSEIVGINFAKTSNGILEVTSGSVPVTARDVVRIVYTDTYEKGLYAVALTPTTFSYDPNIYDVPNSISSSSVFKYNDGDVHKVSAYRIGIEVENGLYSKAYQKYNSSVTYSLTIPSARNEYFGAISTITTSSDVVFVDLCDDVAYGVGFSDGGFETLNNKFKSSLEFNIATR